MSEPGNQNARKFTPEKREQYLAELRKGNLKYESARMVGISYRTVERHMADDDEFADAVRRATAEAREGVEKVLRDLALEGDLGAIKMWLTAHDRSTYADKQKVEIDATPAALELSRNEAFSRLAELQATLEARQARMLANGSEPEIIDVPSTEV